MRLSRGSLATNPRDKVYALLGITEECDKEAIKPDFNIPIRELYCQIARYFIERDQKLDVLCQAGYRRSIPNLPSWAPDWSVPFSADDQDLVDVSYPDYWLDVEEYPALVSTSDDANHLILTGIIVNVISRVRTALKPQNLIKDAQTGSKEQPLLSGSESDSFCAWPNTKLENQLLRHSGEHSSLEGIKRMRKHLPNSKIISLYGTTNLAPPPLIFQNYVAENPQ